MPDEVVTPDPDTVVDETPEATQPEEVTETSTDLVAQEQGAAVPPKPSPDPAKRIYSPYELPADPFAAQQFIDTHPGDVDPDLKLHPALQELAVANIQDAVDAHAARGTVVEDPRLQQ